MKFSTYHKTLVEEGGLGGSMAHPYTALTPQKAFIFFDELLTGKLDLTEKLDGINIFAGLDFSSGKPFALAARNKTTPPTPDIESLFPKSHGGHDAFLAGFTAIQQKFENLSEKDAKKYQLINEDGTPRYFINLEIVYGEIPNIIQYSEDMNYIKFHMYSTGPDGDWENVEETPANESLLKLLAAHDPETVEVTIDGTVISKDLDGNIEQFDQDETSEWKFIGTIHIPKSKIEKDMANTAAEWRNFPEAVEVERYMNDEELTDEERDKAFEALKKLTLKIGSEVLSNVTSELFKEGAADKMPEGHPKIEGLIAKGYEGHDLLKVTGDFPSANSAMRGVFEKEFEGGLGVSGYMEQLTQAVFELLKIKLKKLTKKTWENADSDAQVFMDKRSKLKGDYSITPEELKTITDLAQETKEGIAELETKIEGHPKEDFLKGDMLRIEKGLQSFISVLKESDVDKVKIADSLAKDIFKR